MYDDRAYGDPDCGADECCGASISGTILSDSYDQKCFSLLTPRALIYAGSTIDDFGSVGGVVFTPRPEDISILEEDTEVIPDKVGQRLSLSFSAQNNPEFCGPYGLVYVSVKWYFN
jgi:hypothetical protein